ncbi:MAG TPA: signal peptide peptidase SppA [Kofleriaceae bacterium]
MSPRPLVAGALLVAAAALLSRPAHAQDNFVTRDLTRGVTSPGGGGVAGDYDATAATTNPGGLGMLGGLDLAFTATALDPDSLVGGGGWALSIGAPILRLRGENPFTLTYGFAFQSLDAPDSWQRGDDGAEDQDGSYLVNGIGIGLGSVAIGYSIGTFFWANTPQSSTVTTHHAGIAVHPWRFASFGVTLRDVFEPVGRVAEEKFERSYDLEMAVRPLGDWRVELAGGALVGEDDRVDARARAIVRVPRGIAVYAQYEAVERPFDTGTNRDHRVMAGLTVSGLDALIGGKGGASVSYGGIASRETPGTYAGSSVMVRYTQERYPAVREPNRFEEVSLDTEGDRELVKKLVELRSLERDRGVSGVLLEVQGGDWSYGRAGEIRRAVARLRAAGKKVVAYLRDADMAAYYAVSGSDLVLLHPSADLNLTGLAWQGIYLKELLDKVGVEAQVVQIAEYKSFGEPVTRTGPSDADREQVTAYLQDVSNAWVTAVAADRGVDAASVRTLFDRAAISPPEAVRLRLASGIAHPDELEKQVEALVGEDVRLTSSSDADRHPLQWAFPRIAVIHVEDGIVGGSGGGGGLFGPTVTGDDIADAIERAREDPGVAAIVVRVNSPGGELQASERIAREMELTRGEKPILVSMGDVAASGGYMAALHGERVYAEPGTITGSIGIVGAHFDATSLALRIGIRTDTNKVGSHADQNSLFRRWSDEERDAILALLRHHYGRFVAMVAAGRKLPVAEVEAVARGRIWSGTRAKQSGLVDEMGSLADAMDEARRRAGISPRTEVEVVYWPRVPSRLAELLGVRAALPSSVRHLIASLPAMVWSRETLFAELPWVGTLLRR